MYFTESRAYHVFWETDKYIYDMSLIRRRRNKENYVGMEKTYHVFPRVTEEYLEKKLTEDDSHYGYLDYFLFALRPIYHLFGKSTRNMNGIICSEMINNDLYDCGYITPWSTQIEPPSPADFENWIKGMERLEQDIGIGL